MKSYLKRLWPSGWSQQRARRESQEYRIVRSYPHDHEAFTQGLAFADDLLYEGTGLYGRSSVRQVDPDSGKVLRARSLDRKYYGEGITAHGNRLIQLTWKDRIGFVYSRVSFELIRTFSYSTEGWGITQDTASLIMSDGSSVLTRLDPTTFELCGKIEVRDGHRRVSGLNDLQYARGEIYANVWPTTRVARISPRSGRVEGWIDFAPLVASESKNRSTNVLNGIAYNEGKNSFYITGKFWPRLFEIALPKGGSGSGSNDREAG